MKLITCLSVALALALTVAAEQQQQQQKVLRRIIKSTPTASNLGRIRQVTVRSAEKGAVAEISSKEAASFGQRSANETLASQPPVKTKSTPTTTTSTTTTTTTTQPPSSTSQTTAPPSSSTPAPSRAPKASERQQAQPEVELLSSAPSSWQSMTAVEAPASMLIATGMRTAEAAGSDLSSSSSNSDLLRASSTKNAYSSAASSSSSSQLESVGETFSRLRQQTERTQQQSFFYPPGKTSGKTSQQSTKTHWYQPTTARPAPLVVQEEQQQHYEQQQSEQYVEQQAEYNAAPPGQAEPFAFDFNTRDSNGNGQYRKEESDKDGVVHGSYGYTDANGIYRHVDYVADRDGFRANIRSNEPGLMAETPAGAASNSPRAETQPASIQLASGSAPARLTDESGSWSGELNNGAEASGAAAPPNFESSHKSERIRAARHFRN